MGLGAIVEFRKRPGDPGSEGCRYSIICFNARSERLAFVVIPSRWSFTLNLRDILRVVNGGYCIPLTCD